MRYVTVGMLGCFSVGIVLVAGGAQEQKLKSSEVPKVVSEGAAKRYPKASFSGWSKETEDGKTTYEASVKDDSLKYDVVMAEDGSFVAKEEAISVPSLPASVTSAVKAKYPKATIAKAEKITRSEDVQYEVDLKNSAKKEVLFSSEGQVVKEE